jgi:hypothetical protein
MRIIDKRKDYYDGVVLHSPDPVWVRKESSFSLGEENPFRIPKDTIERLLDSFREIPTPSIRTSSGIDFTRAMVSFCGRIYVVWYKNTYLNRPQDIVSANKPSSFVKKWNDNTEDKKDHIKLDDQINSLRWFRQFFNDKMFDKWKLEYENMSNINDLHRTFKSPVFMITQENRRIILTINPLLVNVGFQVVMEPWTMVQELERYVGNDLVDTPLDDFKMSDELKRDSKGMDDWSFKQRGPKARKQKKK